MISSDRSLAVSIGRNTLSGIAARLTWAGTRMLMVPIVIAYLGIEGYGLWAIIMAMVAYMRFGSAGIKSAFQKYVAEATGSGDFGKTNQLISTGTAVMSLLVMLGLVPVALFSTSL